MIIMITALLKTCIRTLVLLIMSVSDTPSAALVPARITGKYTICYSLRLRGQRQWGKKGCKSVDSQPSRARYRFLVPVSTFTLFTFRFTASSLLTAITINSFLPSTRIPPLCIIAQTFTVQKHTTKSLIRPIN